VNGFRIDAAEILIDPYGIQEGDDLDLTQFLNDMREFMVAKRSDAILLAEVNIAPKEMTVYLNKGQRMHMLFNFFINQHFFLSLVRQNVSTLVRSLKALPPLSHNNQWLNFLRHHDELSLKLLKKKEKEEIFERFAPEEDMRIFNRGIRRRLAPMLDNDRTMLEFCYSVMFSLPGVPLIRYGDEIGMGDDLSLSGRASVHTPMQWSGGLNAGFSSTGKNNLEQPVIDKGTYRFQKVNVMEENRNPESLLNWVERLVSTRKQCPEIGSGELQILPVSDKRILVHAYTLKNEKVFFLHNFSGDQVQISRKRLKFPDEQLFDIFSREPLSLDNDDLTIDAYAYHWLRVPTALRS
jgi:maltose alpha-D-glucosyltransferase/alpha-amylase